ncbi:hypothetical protein [Rhizobium sp. BK602]|uniref:hypothetical protein n=1 Tax=Rhizobium sp. BK602 TaxID=2586986 RepID=UPI0016205CE9|nr:hypothetical protein [Rhizobium sp. BK602]MBB3608467.1 hypothetical protein [Rhizobium sp. BK602]
MAIGERTDAVAKIAPAATDVNNLPVIVNLPFILMGMFTSAGGATSWLTITVPVRKEQWSDAGLVPAKVAGSRLWPLQFGNMILKIKRLRVF